MWFRIHGRKPNEWKERGGKRQGKGRGESDLHREFASLYDSHPVQLRDINNGSIPLPPETPVSTWVSFLFFFLKLCCTNNIFVVVFTTSLASLK